MSKRINAAVQCPKCGHQWEQEIYRSLWVEYPENMALVMSDDIFRLRCPACQQVTDVAYTLLATNVQKSYAVWFEPVPDAGIDVDRQFYDTMFGPANFYSEAPRIDNWEVFKDVLNRYDRGELNGTPIDRQRVLQAAQFALPKPPPRPSLLDRLKRLFKG